jgi:glycosyltransferase involved in cell wall biosynthesis
MIKKTLRILGTRGVPAAHGGFETFAEYLSLYLVSRGWTVVVYCQEDGAGSTYHDQWQGVDRVHIPISQTGPKGTIVFDWLAIRHAAQYRDLCLTLGYNTAIFSLFLRLKRIPNLINMDGIEWSRAKWGPLAKTWFWLNDWAGCWLGDHLIADHPQIARHLTSRVSSDKVTTIPYGADSISSASTQILASMGLEPYQYMTCIARPEPENSLLEIVRGFSALKRGIKLVILGNYQQSNAYHRAVQEQASDEVHFVGAIYEQAVVQALRFYSRAYVHGHRVGGTNPSLVEALGAKNPVIAHDNRFNRWVAAEGAIYFDSADSFSQILSQLEASPKRLIELRQNGEKRFKEMFTWNEVLAQYEVLLAKFLPRNL